MGVVVLVGGVWVVDEGRFGYTISCTYGFSGTCARRTGESPELETHASQMFVWRDADADADAAVVIGILAPAWAQYAFQWHRPDGLSAKNVRTARTRVGIT